MSDNRKLGRIRSAGSFPRRQNGAVTMFSAVLILVLLTEMVIYAVSVGLFEQRKSGNELRQKQAFHAAETGIQHGQAYLLANASDITSYADDGWLSDTFVAEGGSGRWVSCDDANLTEETGSHPCYGEPLDADSDFNLRDTTYFFSLNGSDPANLPLQVDDVLPDANETVVVQALLCLLDVDRTPGSVPVRGCLDKASGDVNNIYFVVTLLARGEAECNADGDCEAEALIAQKLGSFGPLTGVGGPATPLTSRSSFPPGGTSEIVPNPNGAGVGVPVSAWLNANQTPGCGSDIDPLAPISGSWSTCERHEWYGVSEMPDENSPNGKYTCPFAGCSCGADERRISYPDGDDQLIGIDIIVDEFFPCDLFEYTFNVPRAKYLEVKEGPGVQVITDCGVLGPESRGTIWIDGSVDTCKLTSTVVGSPDYPVFLISAADLTSLAGNAVIYGLLYVTDVEGSAGELEAAGTNTLYGAAVVDGDIGKFSGTYQIVYSSDLIERATKTGSIGKIYGGWTDFHQDWR